MSTRTGRPISSRQQRIDDRRHAQEETARICTNFIKHLFKCPELPEKPPPGMLPLRQFVFYIIQRGAHPSCVPMAALFLIERFKTRLPTINLPIGHRLFLAAYLVASKLLIDVNYSNYQWFKSPYNIFPLADINQMERDLLHCLKWDLQLPPDALAEFEDKVRRIFSTLGPYPPYILPATIHALTPFSQPPDDVDATSFGVVAPPATATAPERASSGSPMDLDDPAQLVLPSPSSDFLMLDIPGALPTPELWRTTSATPASSAMPPTPAGLVGSSVGTVVATGAGKGNTNTNTSAANFSTMGNLLTRVIASVL